jgi:rare lipoprotein A
LTLRGFVGALLPLAASAALAACSGGVGGGTGFTSAAVVTPAAVTTALASPPADPKGLPNGGGYYKVGEPYRIAGKTYVPREEPHYSKVGVASWYGYDFHGRKTANGEIYDLNAVTAAHPTLPLPSYARVTNLDNGRSIMVRINDRGPFVDDRIIDVSRTVARKLDFEHEGTADVRVEYIGPASLDGDDEKMLLASYRDPQTPPNQSGGPIVLVAAAPASAGTLAFAGPGPLPPAPRPGPAPATGDAVPSPVLRTGASGQAGSDLSPALEAAAVLDRSDLSALLTLAAAKKASELGLNDAPQ